MNAVGGKTSAGINVAVNTFAACEVCSVPSQWQVAANQEVFEHFGRISTLFKSWVIFAEFIRLSRTVRFWSCKENSFHGTLKPHWIL